MELTPGGIVAWILVGLIAGWAAGKVSRGHGFGLLGDLVVGLLGALLGGLVAGIFIHGSAGFVGTLIVAFIGAVILLGLLRLFARPRLAG
jgi:uncharacterized membrane protein YeaQ/YmgE (transglycosylase-associated protein family)